MMHYNKNTCTYLKRKHRKRKRDKKREKEATDTNLTNTGSSQPDKLPRQPS